MSGLKSLVSRIWVSSNQLREDLKDLHKIKSLIYNDMQLHQQIEYLKLGNYWAAIFH